MERNYIVTLKHGVWQKRFIFVGEDTGEMNAKWNEALKDVGDLAPTIEDHVAFFNKAIDLIGSYGFWQSMP